jgi:hypothetical protein
MADEIASLGIVIDATQVTPAAAQLDVLTAAGAKAETSTAQLTFSTKALATALAATGNDLGKASALLLAQADAAKLSGAVQTATATQIVQANQAVVMSYVATAEAVNAAAGITDTAFKSASASASVFATSLEGVAAIQASTAEVVVAASVSMAESLGALGSAAVRNAAIMVETEEMTATAAVEGAAVTVAAHGAVGTSSRAVTESVVLVREAMRGNFTRMAGSTSILLQALGLLNVVLLPVIATVAVFGSIGLIATQQINEGAGKLTDGLGLTEKQLDRLNGKFGKAKEISVTFGDTFKATFEVLWKDIEGNFGTATGQMAHNWQSFVDGARVASEYWIAFWVGSWIGAFRAVEEAWKMMPTYLGGESKSASMDFATAFKSGLTDTVAAVDQFYTDVGNKARANRIAEILKEAGRPGAVKADGAVSSAERDIQKLNDEAKAQEALNDAVNNGTLSVADATEKQKLYGATASIVARIEQDAKLNLAQKTILIDQLTAAQQRKNAADIAAVAIVDINKQERELQILALQTDLIGKNTLASSVALAGQKATFEAIDKHMSGGDAERYIENQKAIAAGTVTLKEATTSYNETLALQANLYAEIDSAAQKAASSMASAFGSVGTAIGGMATALTSYAAQQASFAAEQDRINTAAEAGANVTARQTILTEKQANATNAAIGDELSGFKGLFDSKSQIYKGLNAVEGVYNAFILANAVARTIASVTETTTKVAGVAITSGAQIAGAAVETETTGVSVANAGTQASAWGVTAIAKAIASLPFPMDLIAGAAVAAALVGFGVLISGGGGGGGAAPDDALNGGATAKNEQAAQGSGSVLGDATAKSASIANSLTQLAKDTNADLDYSNQMVISLKSIQNDIGKVAASISAQLGPGGALNTSSLGLGSSSSGGLLGMFANTTTKVLQDQGVQIAAATVAQIAASGVGGQTYQQVQTTNKNSGLFGLFGSSSTSSATTTANLPGDISAQISATIAGLGTTVVAAATKLGVSGAQAVVDSFTVNIGKISLAGMTGTQITDALNAVFSKVGDGIAGAVFPQLKSLAQVGEGSLETLSRLVNEYRAVDDAMAVVGNSFNVVGIDSLAARDRLVQFSGGIDQFTTQANFFASNFLTSAQALLPIQKAVSNEMSNLGAASVTTKAQFVSLIQGIDVSTTSGAALYAALMNVAPAFAKVADAATALATQQRTMEITLLQAQGNTLGATNLKRQQELAAIDASLQPLQLAIYAQEDLNAANTAAATAQAALTTANDNLSKAQQAVDNAMNSAANSSKTLASALQSTISQFTGFVTSLTAFNASLSTGTNSGGGIFAQYSTSKSAFSSLASSAANGDASAISQLQTAAQTFLTASQTASATSSAYATDLAFVKSAVSAATVAAQKVVNATSDQYNGVIAGQNAATLAPLQAAVIAAQNAVAVAMANVPGHASGLSSVPYDGYLMRAHKDEAILPSGDAAQWRANKGANDNAALIAEIRGMRRDLITVNAKIEKSTAYMAKKIREVTPNGNSISTSVAA